MIHATNATFADLRRILSQGVERVVVDLADVPFIDSRGLVALVAGYQLFGGDAHNFRLAALQDQPKLLFELTGFDSVFQIFDSSGEAIAAGSSGQAQPVWSALALEAPLADLALRSIAAE